VYRTAREGKTNILATREHPFRRRSLLMGEAFPHTCTCAVAYEWPAPPWPARPPALIVVICVDSNTVRCGTALAGKCVHMSTAGCGASWRASPHVGHTPSGEFPGRSRSRPRWGAGFENFRHFVGFFQDVSRARVARISAKQVRGFHRKRVHHFEEIPQSFTREIAARGRPRLYRDSAVFPVELFL
jgi:hypothetical protein